MSNHSRKPSEDTRDILKNVSLLLGDHIDTYTEDIFMKEEDGLVEFILDKIEIKTTNYYGRVFSIYVDNEWIEVIPTSIHICLQPIVDLIEKEFNSTSFSYRCKNHDYQIFSDKLAWELLKRCSKKLSSNQSLDILMDELITETKSSMD